MLKKTLEVTRLDGTKFKKDFYFNYFEHEFLKTYFREDGNTLEDVINELYDLADEDEVNKFKLLNLLEEIFGGGVGTPSEDGITFDKFDGKAHKDLLQSSAYTALLYNLMENPKQTMQDVVKMMPSDRQKEMDKQMKESGINNMDIDNMSPEQMRAEMAKMRQSNNTQSGLNK